ncbi:hypothetical protein IKE86_03035 [Candidatus Saccharibacteria bacterium]|nr:hypothetical protein [Candidatus Saccharibacteria bacterium]
MNKETIYIEPSDDITDVLSKLKNSDKKIVALVPPKKPAVLLSAVNVKLIARTAKAEKKAVVLITADDALTKLAMTANLPVAKSLKSRPVMPGETVAPDATADSEPKPTKSAKTDDDDSLEKDDAKEPSSQTETEEDAVDEIEKEEADDEETDSGEEEDEESDDDEEEDDDDDEDDDDKKTDKKKSKKSKKAKKEKPEATGVKGFLSRYKIWVILGCIFLVGLTGFLIWAFKFAPEVRVAVSVRTTSANFSENVIFTTQAADENIDNSTFSVHEEKLEKEQVVKFTATGKKDMGEAASGTLVVYYQDKEAFSISLKAGSEFTHGSFKYISTNDVVLAWDGESDETCETGSSISKGCLKSASITVKAAAAGEDYNLSGQQTGWAVVGSADVNVYNSSDISGGTSRIVTVVQQSDVDLALDKMKSESGGDGKNELLAKISNTVMPIEASFKVEATDPQVAPAVGEEVKEGVTPQISTKTSYSVLTVDNVRIEDFIKKKAGVEEGKRLYSTGEPFVEYFSKTNDTTYSAKLKTTYKVGPEISETEILEKIQGEKIGRLEPVLKDAFSGVSSVKTEKSYFWVNSVPSDVNKIHIELTVEE